MTSTIRISHDFYGRLFDVSDSDQSSTDYGGSQAASHRRPLIAHVLNRFDVGGLETVMVELINASGEDVFRHVVICLTEYTEFRKRITAPGVDIYALHKLPGKDIGCYWRLWKIFRQLRLDLVQTYNIGTIDVAVPAWLAGVRFIVHAEHGRTADDPVGRNAKYNLLRRILNPIISRYVAVSDDLNRWLVEVVGLPAGKVTRIYNGVRDPHIFLNETQATQRLATLPVGFASPESIIFVNVGRLDPVKDQAGLIEAFVYLVNQLDKERAASLRLVIVGDGPESNALKKLVSVSGVQSQILMTGSRPDISCLLTAADVFVSSSIAEGISMTILEAMACARAVIATAVGGNPEVVVDGETGILVSAGAPQQLAMAMCRYVDNRDLVSQHGAAGRVRVVEHFSQEQMVRAYVELYESLMQTNSIQGQNA